MHVTCSEHCLNWKVDDIMVVLNLLVHMKSLRPSELIQML